MCGITGGINIDIEQMSLRQVHRGPDAEDFWFNGEVKFGHNLLSIIGNQKQPLESARYVLSFNGEIYNYRELATYLSPNDDLASFKPAQNDSAAFLAYIEKFGLQKALRDSIGMWAFALYDKIEKKIHLIVDRMGEKPLYYTEKPFAFASSPAPLLGLKEKWKLNKKAVQSYWLLGSVMEDSIWEGIKKVDSASIVTYDLRNKTFSESKYWVPKFRVQDIEEITLDAINKTKVADVPVYIFLSGGIDSTVVASQFKHYQAIHMDSPEKKYAEQVSLKFSLGLKVITPKEVDPSEAAKDYSLKSGEPSMSAIIPWMVARELKEIGVKCAISANGADELFFGYNRTHQDITEVQCRHIFRNLPMDKIDFELDERLSKGRWFELMTYVKCDLNKTLDFASMAHSVEVRSPYLDYRLVEAALSIPQAKHGRKYFLKQILRKLGFGDEFLNRPKMGFSLYVQPNGLAHLKRLAFDQGIKDGYFPNKVYSSRDRDYLSMSAFGFYQWLEVWKHKIEC